MARPRVWPRPPACGSGRCLSHRQHGAGLSGKHRREATGV